MMSRESTKDIARDARRLAKELARHTTTRTRNMPPRRSQRLDISDIRRELMLRIHPDRPYGDTRLAQEVNALFDELENRRNR